jgi:hypothetical protein
MRSKLYGDAIREVAVEGWSDYQTAHGGYWFRGNVQPREDLEDWVRRVTNDPNTQRVIEWKRNRKAQT